MTQFMKQCKKCKEWKVASSDLSVSEFYKGKTAADGFRNPCKRCLVKNKKRYDSQEKNIPDGYKQCSKCRKVKSLSSFHKNKHNMIQGVQYCCKKCALNRHDTSIQISHKKCSQCRETKPVRDFFKKRAVKDGYDSRCKNCIKAAQTTPEYKAQARRRTKQEKYRAYHRQYARSPKGRAIQKRWANTHAGKKSIKKSKAKARANGYFSRYYKTPKYKEYERQRRKQPHRKILAKQAKARYRTRETEAGGSFTADQWYRLCQFYDFHCLMCNKQFPFDELTVDHIKPVSKSGSSNIKNLQPLCKSCNSRKGDKTLDLRHTIPDWIKRNGPVYQQLKLL